MGKQMKKRNTAGGGLYIALAICVLSVICIGVYSAVMGIVDTTSTKVPSQSGNQNRAPTIVTEPSTTKKPTTTVPNTTTKPSANTGAADSNEGEHSVNAAPTPTTYTLPVGGNVSKEFSNDVLVYSETMNDFRLHTGVDLACAVGTPVKSFTDGTIKDIYEDPLMGYTVVIDHGNETESCYSGLTSSFPEGIEKGVSVKEGQVIGGVGETCLIECAQEPHLHFEVKVNGANVDPMNYFN